jgi:membrane associated rhomboid family serine protease
MYGHRVGASGGVSAIIGSYLFCMLHNQYHRNNVQWFNNPQIVVANIIKMDFAWHYLLNEYAQTTWSLDGVVKKYASSDYVSHSAHLAGLVMGVIVAFGIHLYTRQN